MDVTINARHMDATDAIREYVDTKASKLPKYLDDIHSIEVTLDIDADQPFVEIVVQAPRKHTFVASHRNPDMYACIDGCLSKITEQLRRHKDKIRSHQGVSRSEQTD